MDDGRKQRGQQIADTMKLREDGDLWFVPSQTTPGARYAVFNHFGEKRCTCPDFQGRGETCKHMYAVELVIQRRLFDDGTEAVTKSVTVTETVQRKTYPQDWVNYNLAQVNEHRHFQTLLAELCSTLPVPAPKRGRPTLAPRDAAYCAILKVYSTMSARRFMGDLQESKEAGLIGHVPHFNSVLNFFDSESAFDILNNFVAMSASPMAAVETDFAVDSTGFSSHRYNRWFDKKYGTLKSKAIWIKAHAIVGVRTNVIAAINLSDKNNNDCPQLPGLVKAASEQFTIKEVSGDKAYMSASNFNAVDDIGAKFYPAFKKNTAGDHGGAFGKAYHMFCINRDEYDRHYHKRSNIEATFSALKRKLGEALKSKTIRAMFNETLAKVVAYNLTCVISAMYELGIDPTMTCTKKNRLAQ